jgi:uroporphyrinogen decarboxylase
MRQAGRSLPEYRKVREGVGMLESCMRADLITEITLQPVRRYGVDAAIFFSDIVLPLKAVGVDLDIRAGVGPVVAQPVRDLDDVARIPDLTADHVPYVTEAVGSLVSELGATPLIGFAGAPFTVASYLVEGGPSKDHARTKAMMHGAPEVWDALMRKIAGTGELLGLMGEAGADVVGVDWRVPLSEGIRRVGDRAVQGNLDPTLVMAPTEVMLARAAEVLEEGRAARGHIFNLGHGVLPATDPDQLARLTDFVHEHSAR